MMNTYVTLEIVWSRILVISVRTEWTHVAWAVVNKAVANHLVLTLKTFAAFTAGTTSDWAIVRSI